MQFVTVTNKSTRLHNFETSLPTVCTYKPATENLEKVSVDISFFDENCFVLINKADLVRVVRLNTAAGSVEPYGKSS